MRNPFNKAILSTPNKDKERAYLTRAEREALKLAAAERDPKPAPIIADMLAAVLLGLQDRRMSVYQGTADPAEVARRREANRRARRTRINNARREQ